jgi:hypothetical protein
MEWLSRDMQMRTTDGGRMVSVPGEEAGEATQLTNVICEKYLVHGRKGTDGSKINAVPQMYATLFRMSDLEFLGGEALSDSPFSLTANGARLDCEVMQAVCLSPAVRELSADACARSFALSRTEVLESLQCVFSGDAVSDGRLLGRQLCNPVLELLDERTGPDRFNLNLVNLSRLSLEALDVVLAGESFSVRSEDEFLEKLFSLGEKYRLLLRWVEMTFLSASGLAALAEHLGSPAEWAWSSIADHLLILPLPPTPVLDSAIISDFPDIFAEFCGKRFSLLWWGGRDGFGARDLHSRCDDHANSLTVILDTDGNDFGGFTPMEWESQVWNAKWADMCKADESLKSFLFTLKNPHNGPARRFALKAERKHETIFYHSICGPLFRHWCFR